MLQGLLKEGHGLAIERDDLLAELLATEVGVRLGYSHRLIVVVAPHVELRLGIVGRQLDATLEVRKCCLQSILLLDNQPLEVVQLGIGFVGLDGAVQQVVGLNELLLVDVVVDEDADVLRVGSAEGLVGIGCNLNDARIVLECREAHQRIVEGFLLGVAQTSGGCKEVGGAAVFVLLPQRDALEVSRLAQDGVGHCPALSPSQRAVDVPCLVGSVPVLEVIEFASHLVVVAHLGAEPTDDVLRVLGLDLGPHGLAVDLGPSVLVGIDDGVEFQCLPVVAISINERMTHRLDIHLLTHSAVRHEFVIEAILHIACHIPCFGLVFGFFVGECWSDFLGSGLDIIDGECHSVDGLLDLGDHALLRTSRECQNTYYI